MITVVGTLANAAHLITIQLLALVTLDVYSYGSFSLQYLLFALGISLMLSLVSDAWVRSRSRVPSAADWDAYGAAALVVAIGIGIVTLILSFAIPVLTSVAWIGAVAVVSAVFRSGARYFSLRVGDHRRVVPADLVGFVSALALWVLIVLLPANRELWAMTLVWAGSSVSSVLLSARPRFRAIREGFRWFTKHRREIRILLRDSILLDAGSIGTPYLLAPILGLSGFAIYRAVSNIAAPVRFLLHPLRPRIASMSPHSLRRPARLFLVVAASVVLGMAAAGGLMIVDMVDVDLGALNEVVPFAAATALYVGANFMGTYYYLAARAHSSGRELIIGRIVQTVLAISAPLAGVAMSGLVGAIWGYALATAISAVVWAYLIVRRD